MYVSVGLLVPEISIKMYFSSNRNLCGFVISFRGKIRQMAPSHFQPWRPRKDVILLQFFYEFKHKEGKKYKYYLSMTISRTVDYLKQIYLQDPNKILDFCTQKLRWILLFRPKTSFFLFVKHLNKGKNNCIFAWVAT